MDLFKCFSYPYFFSEETSSYETDWNPGFDDAVRPDEVYSWLLFCETPWNLRQVTTVTLQGSTISHLEKWNLQKCLGRGYGSSLEGSFYMVKWYEPLEIRIATVEKQCKIESLESLHEMIWIYNYIELIIYMI